MGEYVFNKAKRKMPNGKTNHRVKKPESEIIRIPGGMPAIIDVETFEKVQEILAKRKNTLNRGLKKTKYLLSDKLACGHCGYSISGMSRFNKSKRNPEFIYRHSKHGNCTIKEVRIDLLDRWVYDIVLKDFSNIKGSGEYLKIINHQIQLQSINPMNQSRRSKKTFKSWRR